MKLFPLSCKAFFLASFTMLSLTFSVWADVDPDQVAAQAQEEAPPALAQFPQVQTISTPPPAPTGPNCPPGEALFDVTRQDSVASGAPDSENFPKVQTAADEELAKKFAWWPSDAKPAPYKDPNRSGYWWWPDQPGQARPWGNQGYIYVRKLIFDYKGETVQTPQGPMKPSLVIKRIIKNVKVFFDYDKADLRDDAMDALQKALYTLNHNDKADILVTGNADIRGSEQYNAKLGERRASSVQRYLIEQGLSADRIRILSRGKLDALAPSNDLVGMQKDRNAQFMIAEVEEVMIPADKAALFEEKQLEEKQEITGEVRVSTKDYVIQTGDTLWKIAEREYGDGRQWKRLYEFNRDVIANPNRPKKGTRIQIPQE